MNGGIAFTPWTTYYDSIPAPVEKKEHKHVSRMHSPGVERIDNGYRGVPKTAAQQTKPVSGMDFAGNLNSLMMIPRK